MTKGTLLSMSVSVAFSPCLLHAASAQCHACADVLLDCTCTLCSKDRSYFPCEPLVALHFDECLNIPGKAVDFAL